MNPAPSITPAPPSEALIPSVEPRGAARCEWRFRAFIAAANLLVLLLHPAEAQVPQIINYQGRVAVGGVNFDGTGQFKFALVDGGTNTAVTAQAIGLVDGAGHVTSVTVTSGGSGYTSPPAVTFSSGSGGGSGAAATAVVSGGSIIAINVTNGGSNYVLTAAVSIAAPPPSYVYQSFWSNDGSYSPGGGAGGNTEPVNAVPLQVTKGLYSVLLGDQSLNPGPLNPIMTPIPPSVFSHPDVRLRVWFNDGVSGSQLMLPDQRLTAVGYAMIASTVPDGSITASKIADGAIGSAQIAPAGVATANISAGAVGATQLAGSAVTSTILADGAVSSAKLALEAVGAAQLANGAVMAGNIAVAQVVKTMNGLTDAVTLAPGSNVTITPPAIP